MKSNRSQNLHFEGIINLNANVLSIACSHEEYENITLKSAWGDSKAV